jgi:glycosyltransferase involved in cell wall biosynthesis
MYTRTEARQQLVQFFPELQTIATDPWIACVAELHPIKRHRVLFEAIAQIKETVPRLRLLCIGDGQLRTELETYIQAHNLGDNVYILGPVTEAARFLRGFDSFALASQSESYGYVLHEAGLAKLPVVATTVGGIPDIVTNKETGLLVPPNDSPALAKALLAIHQNHNYAQSLAKALHDNLSQRTVKKMTEATTVLYTL